MRAQSSAATAALSCSAHSLARSAAAKILRLIDSVDTAGLRLALRRPLRMRRCNLRLQPLRLRLYLRQHLRRRMYARRQRKRKVRKSKIHKRKVRKSKIHKRKVRKPKLH